MVQGRRTVGLCCTGGGLGTIGKKKISIDISGENNYKIIGDNMSWAFETLKGDEKVGPTSKGWGIIDNYGVRIVDGASEVDILLCGILVDAVYHGGVSYH